MIIEISVAVIALTLVVTAGFIIRLLYQMSRLMRDVQSLQQELAAGFAEVKDESSQIVKSTRRWLTRIDHKQYDSLFTVAGIIFRIIQFKNLLSKGEEKRMGNHSKGDMILSAIIGGVIGVAGALLFAPKTGEETRENLKQYSETLKDRMEDLLEKINDMVKTAGDQAVYKERVKEWIERLKTVTSGVADEGEDTAKVKQQLDEINRQLEDIYREVAASSPRKEAE